MKILQAHQLRALAVAASVDPRTVALFVRGQLQEGAAYNRIRSAFEAHGLPIAVALPRKPWHWRSRGLV